MDWAADSPNPDDWLWVGAVDFALSIGSNLFRGLAVRAVGIELDVGVEIGHSGLIVFLAQVNQRQQVIDLGLIWRRQYCCKASVADDIDKNEKNKVAIAS